MSPWTDFTEPSELWLVGRILFLSYAWSDEGDWVEVRSNVTIKPSQTVQDVLDNNLDENYNGSDYRVEFLDR